MDANDKKIADKIMKPFRSELYDCNGDPVYGYYESEVYTILEQYATLKVKEYQNTLSDAIKGAFDNLGTSTTATNKPDFAEEHPYPFPIEKLG